MGYRTVWLEEYDYFDSYYSMKAVTDKNTDSCLITLNSIKASDPKVRNLKISKQKSIDYFKLQMQENFSNDEQIMNFLREQFDSYVDNSHTADEDVESFERQFETVNLVRGLHWIFNVPLSPIELADFLPPDKLRFFENWKTNRINNDENRMVEF